MGSEQVLALIGIALANALLAWMLKTIVSIKVEMSKLTEWREAQEQLYRRDRDAGIAFQRTLARHMNGNKRVQAALNERLKKIEAELEKGKA